MPPKENINANSEGGTKPDVYSQIKWNGWGSHNMQMKVDDKDKSVVRHVSGRAQRHLVPFINGVTGSADPNAPLTPSPSISIEEAIQKLPQPVLNEAFLSAIQEVLKPSQLKLDGEARVTHIMGKNYRDLWRMRRGMIDRAPDAIILPHCHEDVVKMMELCHQHNVVVIAYGGGTNVTGCIEPSPFEKERMIVSVDMRRMNKMLDMDKESRTCVFQAGVLGPDLDEQIGRHGFMFGHDPDSYIHSTLGGWVGARSSGAMSNKYGEIEQMVIGMKLVTPTGVIQTPAQPRPAGPDFNGLIIGSEGVFGIVTECTIKVEKIPPVKHYEGWLFPSFDEGVRAFQKVTAQGINPTAMRLYDADETKLSFAMKTDQPSVQELVGKAIKQFLKHVKGFDMEEVCLCIMGYEGTQHEVNLTRAGCVAAFGEINAFCAGTGAGANWQEKKYDLPYARDFALSNTAWADVFETVVVYSEAINLHKAVKKAVQEIWEKEGRKGIIGCHTAHQYKMGCCLYFTYLGLQNDEHDFEMFLRTKRAATEAMIRHKGSPTHHHGIGYEMVPWMERYLTPQTLAWLYAMKNHVDPKGICNPGKLMPEQPKEGETKEQLAIRRTKREMFDKMAVVRQRSKL